MQIKVYLLVLISFITTKVLGQEMFPKKELYHVWILAGEDLDKGHFDDAAMLYGTHTEHQSFKIKLQQVAYLKKIRSDAEKLQKRGNLAEAVEKYKEYRKLKDIGTIGIFEKRISECLTLINQRKLNDLTTQQRVITGFEWAHRGRQKLSLMDTIGAKKDFNNARILGGNRNSILKEQYQEGTRILEALTQWGKDKSQMELSSTSLEEQLAFLKTYRDIRNLDLPEVELQIKEKQAIQAGNNSLKNIAKLCDTELLLNFVQNNSDQIKDVEALTRRLNEYKSTVQKINQLKLNTDNAATVESAYASLLSWIVDFPLEIRDDLTACILSERFQTFENYSEMAKNNSNKKAEEEFKKIARQPTPNTAISEPEKPCEGIPGFNANILHIKKDLSNCNAAAAKSKWLQGLSYLKDCKQKVEILSKNQSLKESIDAMIQKDSLVNEYLHEAQLLVADGKCTEAIKVYVKMKNLRACDQQMLDNKIADGMLQASHCKKNAWWKAELTGSFSGVIPKYKLSGVPLNMGNGHTTSGGIQISYIDHKNPAEFAFGLEYFDTQYYSVGSLGSVLENYRLKGVNGIFAIKLHLPNTNPNKIRPYLKLGTEFMIPTSYDYESFSSFKKVSGTEQIQNTILSVTGAVGLEIQKKNFGASIEGFSNFMMAKSIYNDSLVHIITTRNQPIEASITKLGIRVGLRFW